MTKTQSDVPLRNLTANLFLLALVVLAALAIKGVSTPSPGYWHEASTAWPVHDFNERTGKYTYRQAMCGDGYNEMSGISTVLLYTTNHTILCGGEMAWTRSIALGWHPARYESIYFETDWSPHRRAYGLVDGRNNAGVLFWVHEWWFDRLTDRHEFQISIVWSHLFCDAALSCELRYDLLDGFQYWEWNA